MAGGNRKAVNADATMSAMLRNLRAYLIALACVWLALGMAAWFYCQRYPLQSYWILSGLLPACLFESVCYLGIGFEEVRTAFGRTGPRSWQALLLTISGVVPYLLSTATSGLFQAHGAILLAAVCAAVSFWYVLVPRQAAYDVVFIVIIVGTYLSRIFAWLYLSPIPKLHLEFLGHLAWIHIGLMALLIFRQWEMGPFTFWPRWQEWKEGILQFLFALAPLSLAGILLHFVTFSPRFADPAKAALTGIGTFGGVLWVVAVGEEAFFRGFIAQGIFNRTRSLAAAVVISSLLFGSAHLTYRAFPNWSFATVAALSGVFYAFAYFRKKSIRASMVAHAFLVTAWRLLFQ